MDQRDSELLDKQFRAFPQREDGTGIWAAFAILFAGLTIGGLLYVYEVVPARVASGNGSTLTALLNDSQPNNSQLQ
jgi:hypothetical protein